MPPITIRSPPSAADYIPLEEYQEQTPESFIDGKPVLHFELMGATASVPKAQKKSLVIFPDDPPNDSNSTFQGSEDEMIQQTVNVFVTSESFIIFNMVAEVGLSIPYPSISIHALKPIYRPTSDAAIPAVWMQLELADGGTDDEEFDTVDFTILPPPEAPRPSDNAAATETTASQLYNAIATCSNLHPDPDDDQEEDEEGNYDRIVFEDSAHHEPIDGFTGVMRGVADGGLPPPLPGSGGWITAENVNEYFDEEGNWIGGGEELGDGAGRIRGRDEVDGNEVNGHDAGEADDTEAKRARTG